MLAERGIFTEVAFKELLRALRSLDFTSIKQAEYDGSFEDLFYYLQREITKNCDPDTAGKLHTARSRNDIDVTIYRLHLRQDTLKLLRSAMDLRRNLLNLVSEH